ncbi:MFS transporter [bacterium]|nr:MFS transporter [bacterium]MCI0602774.1 MFS transporter [bacterium]
MNISQRLDNLPLSRVHWKIVTVCGLGWLFDAMDAGIIAFVLAVLMKQWKLSADQVGLIASIGLMGMFAGSLMSGVLADRVGRKYLFQATLLIFSIATGLCGLAAGFASLLVLRFLVGFGLGGELPVASTLVTEYSPAQHRGRLLVILESFWAFGWVAAAIISFLIIPRFEQGWKIAFFIGFLPAFYVFYLRRSIPESPRYLEAAGRHMEAREALRWLENQAQVPPVEITEETKRTAIQVRLSHLWQGKFVRRTLMLWILWFAMVYSYYGIFTWLPSLLVSGGHEVLKSFRYVLIITLAQIPGYFSAAFLVDRIGRKATLIPFLIGCAVAAFLFGKATSGTEIIFYGCLISFFNLGAWGVVYTYTPELYPTDMRGTGAGTAAAVGRIGGIVAPVIVGKTLAAGLGQQTVFAQFAAVVIAGAIAVALLGEETKRKSLEEI